MHQHAVFFLRDCTALQIITEVRAVLKGSRSPIWPICFRSHASVAVTELLHEEDNAFADFKQLTPRLTPATTCRRRSPSVLFGRHSFEAGARLCCSAATLSRPERGCVVLDQPQHAVNSQRVRLVCDTAARGESKSISPRTLVPAPHHSRCSQKRNSSQPWSTR
jgi:hypothetical protein